MLILHQLGFVSSRGVESRFFDWPDAQAEVRRIKRVRLKLRSALDSRTRALFGQLHRNPKVFFFFKLQVFFLDYELERLVAAARVDLR